jgi:hypothetical protein
MQGLASASGETVHACGRWRALDRARQRIPGVQVSNRACRKLCAAHANCALAGDGLSAACVWFALEPIAAWRREAQAVKATLEVAARLNIEAVPYEVWQRLDMDREQF